MTNTDEFLEHFGVKGMHWGRRSASSDSGGSSNKSSGKAAKPEPKKKITTADIKDARIRDAARADRVNQSTNNLNLATTKKGQEAAAKVYTKSVNQYLDHPDHKTAQKLTRGEKAVGGLGAVLIAASVASLFIPK